MTWQVHVILLIGKACVVAQLEQYIPRLFPSEVGMRKSVICSVSRMLPRPTNMQTARLVGMMNTSSALDCPACRRTSTAVRRERKRRRSVCVCVWTQMELDTIWKTMGPSIAHAYWRLSVCCSVIDHPEHLPQLLYIKGAPCML